MGKLNMNEIKTMEEYITEHCNLSMDKAIDTERFPLWKRSCETIDDVMFARHGLLRCISSVNSGRHYLQVTDEIYDEIICHSSYFNSLKSPRRMNMVKAIEKQSYLIHSEILSSLGTDYLKQFSELDEYRVEAADGHFIQHACHTKKNSKGKVFAAGFIHALNLRNGLLRPLCVVTNGTDRHQEILRYLPKLNNVMAKKILGQGRKYRVPYKQNSTTDLIRSQRIESSTFSLIDRIFVRNHYLNHE